MSTCIDSNEKDGAYHIVERAYAHSTGHPKVGWHNALDPDLLRGVDDGSLVAYGRVDHSNDEDFYAFEALLKALDAVLQVTAADLDAARLKLGDGRLRKGGGAHESCDALNARSGQQIDIHVNLNDSAYKHPCSEYRIGDAPSSGTGGPNHEYKRLLIPHSCGLSVEGMSLHFAVGRVEDSFRRSGPLCMSSMPVFSVRHPNLQSNTFPSVRGLLGRVTISGAGEQSNDVRHRRRTADKVGRPAR